MKKIDGKTKNIGGLKDISECRTKKLDEPIAVEVVLLKSGERRLISLNDLKGLLFDEPEKIIKKDNSLENSLNNKEYLRMYGKPTIEEFVDYWTEMLPNGKKQRWQKEKAFDIGRRLKTWAKRDYNGHFREHKYQLEKIRQDEYLRKATEQAKKESIMTPEEQKRELDKLTRGLFVDVKKL